MLPPFEIGGCDPSIHNITCLQSGKRGRDILLTIDFQLDSSDIEKMGRVIQTVIIILYLNI